MKYRMKRIVLISVSAALLGGAAGPFLWTKADAVVPGIRMNSVLAGRKTRSELEDIISQKEENLKNEKIILEKGIVHEEIPYESLNLHYDRSSIEDVLAIGRTGNLFQQWEERWKSLLMGKAVHVKVNYDKKALDARIDSLAEEYGKPAKNAEPVIHDDGSITFTEGRPYLKIDKESLRGRIADALRTGENQTLEIPSLEEKMPSMTREEAKEINAVLGSYTTWFGGDPNRSSNIERAAASMDGVYLKPGEIFSFNETTGSRSADNGYKEAPVIINGKLEPGSGGGVCQVSTTLFNAVILSGLEVTQRTCHFSPVSYVPAGRDATVAEGYIDFCFRNHLKHGIYIYTSYVPGRLTVYILGNQEDKPSHVSIDTLKDVTIAHKTITRIDPSQKEEKKVEEGHDGRDVVISQNVEWADGRTFHDTFASDYEAVDTIVTLNKQQDKKTQDKKKTKKGKGNIDGQVPSKVKK